MSFTVMDRPERLYEEMPEVDASDRSHNRPFLEKLWSLDWMRKITILLVLGLVWELGVVLSNINPYIVPSLSSTIDAFADGLASGEIQRSAYFSLKTLLTGYAIGITISAIFVGCAVNWRFASDMLTTTAAMLNPLPAIALLPMAMIWFGLGNGAIIFTLLHSIVWPVSLYTMTGILAISNTLLMMGRNYGLRGPRFVWFILLPAAFPTILSGLRIAWAFSWRTLMAAELVFGGQVSGGGLTGASGGQNGGLGWYIFRSQMENETTGVFAGLLTIILIGVVVENVFFRFISRTTIERWGMSRGA